MRLTNRCLLPALALACLSMPAMAAREFTPQAGLWMIPTENNGQPGRGFSLDVQGNTAFLQVFNYEKSGAATFHTAVGQLDDSASMTVPLLRFKGGSSFGGPHLIAKEDGSPGSVTVHFADGLNGSIQFPGEAKQTISRFLVPEKIPFWWHMPPEAPDTIAGGQRTMKWTATGNDGTRFLWRSKLQTMTDGSLSLEFSQPTNSAPWPEPAIFHCQADANTQVVDCSAPKTADTAAPAQDTYGIKRVRFRALGPDVVGVIQPQANQSERWVLNGWTDGSARYKCQEPCPYVNDITSWAYTVDGFPDGACIPEMCSYRFSDMVLPSSGAWIIEDELNGRPGRGVFLDTQESTLIIQTSDYLQNGEPTFHMGAGNLKASPYDGSDTTATMPLLRYAGGRYFGGPAQFGAEVANAGQLQLMLPISVKQKHTDFATGRIQLPGETAKYVRRLRLDATSNPMADKLGEYLIAWNTSQGKQQRWIQLTRVQDGFAMNDDGTIQCYGAPAGDPNWMRCGWLPSPNINQNWIGGAEMTVNPFHRNAEGYDMKLRTRDRHGNWLGLGKVNLPGLSILAD